MRIAEYKNGVITYRDMSTEDTEAQTDAPELSPAERREQAYNADPCVAWDGDMLTVTKAAQQWSYYAAEGNAEKVDALTALISAAKADIRAKYPDNAGCT